MVSRSPGKECDGTVVRICHHKVVSKWNLNRKTELDGMGVGPPELGAKASRLIMIHTGEGEGAGQLTGQPSAILSVRKVDSWGAGGRGLTGLRRAASLEGASEPKCSCL